jgi:hypothetical protein
VIGSVTVHGSRGGDQVMLRNGIETVGQSGTGFRRRSTSIRLPRRK